MAAIPDEGICPNCQKHSGFATVESHVVWPKVRSSGYVDPERIPAIEEQLTIVSCLWCKKTMLFLTQLVRMPDEEKTTFRPRLVYPKARPRELSEHVPQTIRSLFREASTCESAGALRGAAALYRAAVEKICDDLDVPPGNLYKRLEQLRANGIGGDVVQDLHEARFLGNYSLHDGLEFSAAEVTDVAELIEEACTIVYVQPEERRLMREARQKRRKAHESTR